MADATTPVDKSNSFERRHAMDGTINITVDAQMSSEEVMKQVLEAMERHPSGVARGMYDLGRVPKSIDWPSQPPPQPPLPDLLTPAQKFPHYFKSVAHLEDIDIYRVLKMWQVTDPCIQHAVKKLLVAGKRGNKITSIDVKEAIVALERFIQMLDEDATPGYDDNPF